MSLKIMSNTKNISETEKHALREVRTNLETKWSHVKLLLFGSKVNGTADKESDLDLLIMLPCPVTENIRKQIVHMVFNINLKYETNISPLIVSEQEWNHSPLSVLPIHSVVEKEGIPI